MKEVTQETHKICVIIYNLNLRYISQQVNFPKLFHHNVKEAQNEFHEQPDIHKKSTAKDEYSNTNLNVTDSSPLR